MALAKSLAVALLASTAASTGQWRDAGTKAPAPALPQALAVTSTYSAVCRLTDVTAHQRHPRRRFAFPARLFLPPAGPPRRRRRLPRPESNRPRAPALYPVVRRLPQGAPVDPQRLVAVAAGAGMAAAAPQRDHRAHPRPAEAHRHPRLRQRGLPARCRVRPHGPAQHRHRHLGRRLPRHAQRRRRPRRLGQPLRGQRCKGQPRRPAAEHHLPLGPLGRRLARREPLHEQLHHRNGCRQLAQHLAV